MKYLILGAGPAGLSFAARLRQLGEDSFLIIEKEKEPGGLCRSVTVDGAPFDLGGGHFLDSCRPDINQFLFQFMPAEEWDTFDRISMISLNNKLIDHPIEANIWQMEIEEQVKYLKSAALAGCNLGVEMPEQFIDWIYWKLGKEIADNYMIPYNRKMFADELNELGTYWLNKLPAVNFEEILLSCLKKKAFGKQPGHAKFYYPKHYGYGELWLRMGKELENHIEYNKCAKEINFNQRNITTEDGSRYKADNIITTIPWKEWKEISGMPEHIVNNIRQLKHSSIETRYFPDRLSTDAHWIYYPEQELPYHRILVRHNFCRNSKGYWTETRVERTGMFEESHEGSPRFINTYAYPLNTINKNRIMDELLNWTIERRVYGLGRWGEHQHYNSDKVVELAVKLAEQLEERN